MEELSQVARQILKNQPFSRLVGAKLAKFSEEEAVLEIPIREELLQQNGFVHGGVISYAAKGFGAGLGVSIPGMPLPDQLTEIPLPQSFKALHVGLLWQGKLRPTADWFKNEAIHFAKTLKK